MATKKISEITNQVSDADVSSAKFLVTTGSTPVTKYALGSQLGSGVGGGGQYTTIRRFKQPFVGNKYATSGYYISGADDNFDGTMDYASINAGIGGPASPLDGVLSTGLYMVAIYYPGNTSQWYTNGMGNGFNATVEKNFHTAIGNVTLHNPGITNPVCHATAPGSASTTTLNYIFGNGQTVCLYTNGATTWVHFRSDGKVDWHLRSGNTASWSYGMVVCFQYQ